MNRIDRLFGILTFLQSKKFVTAEKIADKFNISIRTVYRDIKALQEQGIPVSFEQHKGYFIVEGYFLPPVSFSTEEANALLLIEGLVNGLSDRSIQRYYSEALNKVKAVLRNAQKESLERLNQSVRFRLPASIQHDFEYLSVLQPAISTREMLEIDYKNFKDELSHRSIEPIGLIFYAFGWHLIAWCHLRRDYRDFKVSRIMKISHTGHPFEKQDHIAINDYMKNIPVSY